MGSSFAELALVHDEDGVCALDGGHAVRHDHQSVAGEGCVERMLHLLFAHRVEVRSRLVHDDHPRVAHHCAGNGDPLALTTSKLEELTRGLAELPHVTRLRIHTRLPVVLPDRIDEAFLGWLSALPLQKVVVLHANHANEFDAAVDAACAGLRAAGATLLNQAVLLRGINDREDALIELSERLFAAGVLPYYLHQLDRVQGAAHFEVNDDRALALVEAMRARLPGYLVPRLVREVAGDTSKRPL